MPKEVLVEKVKGSTKSKIKGSFYQCQFCPKRIQKKSNIQNHLMIHYNIKPFQCQFCGKSFRQKGHLSYHISHLHMMRIVKVINQNTNNVPQERQLIYITDPGRQQLPYELVVQKQQDSKDQVPCHKQHHNHEGCCGDNVIPKEDIVPTSFVQQTNEKNTILASRK